ncbi:MAG TPA: O-antigen ligase family protein [Nitrospira sp.]|nr:O-antigen ligase family protein [Nitrospira sp.]
MLVIRLLTILAFGILLWSEFNQARITLPRTPIAYPVLLFLGVALLSAVTSPYRDQSIQWLMSLTTYAVLLHLVVFYVKGWEHTQLLLLVIVAMGLVQATLVGMQAWSGRIRPSGTFFNPNFVAGYLVCSWLIVLSWLCFGYMEREYEDRPTGRSRYFLNCLGVASLLLFFVAIVLTGSRGALLTLAIGTAIVVGLWLGKRPLPVAVAMVCSAAVMAAIYLVLPEHGQTNLEYARLKIWESSIDMVTSHPFGIGLGLYQYLYPSFALPIEGSITRFGKMAHSAHNEYLQIGAELGVAGFMSFLWGIVMVGKTTIQLLRREMLRWQRGIVVGMAAAVTSILVHALVDSNLHEPAIAILLVVFVAAIISLAQLANPIEVCEYRRPLRFPFLWKTASILVLAICVGHVVQTGMAWSFYVSGTREQETRHLDQAFEKFATSIALDSGKALYHSALGGLHYSKFQQTGEAVFANEALAELHAAIALNPLDGRLQILLGDVYRTLASRLSSGSSAGERERLLRAALRSYQASFTSQPFVASTHLSAARTYWELGERDRAMMAVRQAIALEPNYLPARQWFATVALEMGQDKLAREQYDEMLIRQRRYANAYKDEVEMAFLRADIRTIAALLADSAQGT